MASRSFTTKWSSMEVDPQFTQNEWNSSSTQQARSSTSAAAVGGRGHSATTSGEYNPYRDKHLKFQSQLGGSHSAPHRPIKDSVFGGSSKRQETVEALHRLEVQRAAYQNVLVNAMTVASLKDPSFLAAAKKPTANEPSAFDVFERAKAKCASLWSELGVEEDRRAHIVAQFFHLNAGEEPSADAIEGIQHEIERSLHLRRLEKEIEFGIRVREGFLYRLLDLAEASKTLHVNEIDSTMKPLVLNIRKATMDICNTIATWREVLGYDAVFLWRGASYLVKLSTDLNVLVASEELVRRFPCRIVGNPLLELDQPNPHRVWFKGEAAAEKPLMPVRTSLLPPILRPAGQQPDGSIISPQMVTRARDMLRKEPELFRQFCESTPQHRFAFIDTTTYDATLIRQLKDVAFNETHAALDFQGLVGGAHNPADDLTPQQRVQIAAANAIQRVWRGHVARTFTNDLRKQNLAAVRIQRVHRVIAAKQEVAERRHRHLAAAKIQGLARGVATRAAMRKYFALTEVAIVIQTSWRGYACRRDYAFLRAVSRSAITIQRWYRGHLARTWVPKVKSTIYHSAATAIQKVWKGGTIRVKHVADPKAIRAAITIQCCWRKYVARRYVNKLRGVRDAALTLQRFAKTKVAAS